MSTPPTVLVTGASSGIGKGFATRYARQGHDVVLVARRADRLDALAAELENAHSVTATVVSADLTDPTAAETIGEHLDREGIEVGILVNCAGFGTAGPFIEEDPARLADEIAVDVVAPTLLTRRFLPSLVAAGTRGALIMVSSTASHQPVPNIAVYAACKAYVTSLTAAIWKELSGTGVRVLALCPGPTDTEFFEAAGSDRFKVGRVGTIDEVLDAAFAALDRGGDPVVTVGRGNRLQAFAAKLAPRRLTLAVGATSTTRAE
jgi:short-subunit dehydrogenase